MSMKLFQYGAYKVEIRSIKVIGPMDNLDTINDDINHIKTKELLKSLCRYKDNNGRITIGIGFDILKQSYGITHLTLEHIGGISILKNILLDIFQNECSSEEIPISHVGLNKVYSVNYINSNFNSSELNQYLSMVILNKYYIVLEFIICSNTELIFNKEELHTKLEKYTSLKDRD